MTVVGIFFEAGVETNFFILSTKLTIGFVLGFLSKGFTVLMFSTAIATLDTPVSLVEMTYGRFPRNDITLIIAIYRHSCSIHQSMQFRYISMERNCD